MSLHKAHYVPIISMERIKMLNAILIAIGVVFVMKGYFAFEEIYPNKTHAVLALVVFIGIIKSMQQEKRRNNGRNSRNLTAAQLANRSKRSSGV
jgi:hypothetical protein